MERLERGLYRLERATEEKAMAFMVAAETGGPLLASVYMALSMACLIDLCEGEFFEPDDVVVYLNTGGSRRSSPTEGR